MYQKQEKMTILDLMDNYRGKRRPDHAFTEAMEQWIEKLCGKQISNIIFVYKGDLPEFAKLFDVGHMGYIFFMKYIAPEEITKMDIGYEHKEDHSRYSNSAWEKWTKLADNTYARIGHGNLACWRKSRIYILLD